MIIFRRGSINQVQYVRSYHSTDCDSDHSLVVCKLRFCPKEIQRSKKSGNPKIETAQMKQREKAEESSRTLELQRYRTVEHC